MNKKNTRMPLISGAIATAVASTVASTATTKAMSTILMGGGQDEKQNPISKLSRFLGVAPVFNRMYSHRSRQWM